MITQGTIWTAEKYGLGIAIWSLPVGKVKMKSMVAKVNDFHRDFEAHARLIAAAPELLDACKGLIKDVVNLAEMLEIDASESVYACIEDASDAIAKAEKK